MTWEFFSVAVTRSRNIPRFGPTIPENSMFPISSTFREFLLTKVINGENTAHYAGKFKVRKALFHFDFLPLHNAY